MRTRFAALACALIVMFGVVTAPAAAATPATTSAAAAAGCPGNFFTRLGLVLFRPSYASYIWLRFC